MSRIRALVCVCAAAAVACSSSEPDPDDVPDPNASIPNFTPPTVIAHGLCGAVDEDATRCSFEHEGCAVGERQIACQKGKSLANPDCAPTAIVAGQASRASDDDDGHDGDFVFDIMPSLQEVILDPSSTPPRTMMHELRTPASFSVQAGTVHIELQSCRFCRGAWVFPEEPGIVFDGELHDGDVAAASGNWVADEPQHEGWSEIHEATAVAFVHAVPGASYILVNAFFVEAPDQRDDLVLDVPVPPPEPSITAPRLRCEVDPPLLQRGCPCGTPFGVDVSATPDDGAALCRLRIRRGPDAPPPLPFNCVNTPPCYGGSFMPSAESCANIAFGGVVRASWN